MLRIFTSDQFPCFSWLVSLHSKSCYRFVVLSRRYAFRCAIPRYIRCIQVCRPDALCTRKCRSLSRCAVRREPGYLVGRGDGACVWLIRGNETRRLCERQAERRIRKRYERTFTTPPSSIPNGRLLAVPSGSRTAKCDSRVATLCFLSDAARTRTNLCGTWSVSLPVYARLRQSARLRARYSLTPAAADASCKLDEARRLTPVEVVLQVRPAP
ncbi:hypothetical protein BV20DRAFT_784059 [Pilatotrama ljubarskyi]|nr:hypothetical protein BV20DRAFT_784059 [Pilatotrama ljubarskyi]